jgi:hypothetical protein
VALSWIPDWSQIENQRICHHLNPFLPVLVLQQCCQQLVMHQ